jgi:hypothetical protein
MKKIILLLVVLFSCSNPTEQAKKPVEEPQTDLLNVKVFLAEGSREGFIWLYYEDSLYTYKRVNYNDTLNLNIPKLNYWMCSGTNNTSRDCVDWYGMLLYPIDYDSLEIGIFI